MQYEKMKFKVNPDSTKGLSYIVTHQENHGCVLVCIVMDSPHMVFGVSFALTTKVLRTCFMEKKKNLIMR